MNFSISNMKNETIKINILIVNIKTCTNEMKEQLALALHTTKLSNQSVSGRKIQKNTFAFPFIFYRIWNVGTAANLLGLLLMTLDSFIAIKWPLKHRILLRKRVIFILISCTWIAALIRGFLHLLITLPKFPVLHSRIIEEAEIELVDYEYCELRTFFNFKFNDMYSINLGQKRFDTINIAVFLTILFVVFIGVVMIYCYRSWVICRLSNHRSNQLHVQQVNINSRQQQTASIRRQQTKGLATTVTLILSFTILWMPITVFQLMKITNDKVREDLEIMEPGYIERVLMIVCSSTSIVDVFICLYFLRPFKFKLRLPCLQGIRNNTGSSATTSPSAGHDLTTVLDTSA